MSLKVTSHSKQYKKRYAGDKPTVSITVEPKDFPGKLFPEWQLEIEDGDMLRVDQQGWT